MVEAMVRGSEHGLVDGVMDDRSRLRHLDHPAAHLARKLHGNLSAIIADQVLHRIPQCNTWAVVTSEGDDNWYFETWTWEHKTRQRQRQIQTCTWERQAGWSISQGWLSQGRRRGVGSNAFPAKILFVNVSQIVTPPFSLLLSLSWSRISSGRKHHQHHHHHHHQHQHHHHQHHPHYEYQQCSRLTTTSSHFTLGNITGLFSHFFSGTCDTKMESFFSGRRYLHKWMWSSYIIVKW